MSVAFTAHNIRLDDGTFTKPENGYSMESAPWFVSARRVLETVFPGDKSGFRLADLGCLEGGYAVEFARMGFQVLGVEVREDNIAACRQVKAGTDLPNLEFVQDNAWNIARHGPFDAVFCCGLLYHLDRPKQFLETLSRATSKLLILQTHFSTAQPNPKFGLSDLEENEGLRGRWFTEFSTEEAHRNREAAKWASWDNRRSFWVMRECLLQAIHDVGFDLVLEQYDGLGADIVGSTTTGWRTVGADIAGSMTTGYYKTDERGTFIGLKTGAASRRRTAAEVVGATGYYTTDERETFVGEEASAKSL